MDKCLEIGVNFFDTAEVRADDLFIKIPHDILFEQTEDDRNICGKIQTMSQLQV